MCMLLGMSKQLVYAFPGFYNKEKIYSNSFVARNFDKFRIHRVLIFIKITTVKGIEIKI